MRNPAWCPWQLHLALAEAHDAPERARAIAGEAVERARQFGTASAIGTALRTAAEVAAGPAERAKTLEEAVGYLEGSPSGYELARALVDHGTALRRTGSVHDAAEQLYRGLEGALLCGADGLAERAREELAAAGLRPRRLRTTDTDALTAQERTVAAHAARGAAPADIAHDLGTDERGVARLLSAVYRKVGTDASGLAQALGEGILDPP
jgi:DNA-binding CsgD family transcriptional regulator